MHHLLFAIVFCVAVAVANAFIYYGFLRQITAKFKPFCIGICAIFFLCNVVFLFSMRSNFLPNWLYSILACMLGISFFFFIVSIVYYLFFKACAKVDFARRKALKKIIDFGFLFVGICVFFQGHLRAISIPPVKKIRLNKGLDKKIAMISDVHLGKNLHEDFLRGLITKINAQNVDAVVIVGDLIDAKITEIPYLSLLNDFRAKDGVFYVTGNHEFYHDAASILKELKKYDIKVLENERVELQNYSIAGIHDLKGVRYGFAPDLAKVSKNLDEKKLNILLTHQPVMAKKFDLSAFDLVLAGHTHAGQIFPFSILVQLQQGFLHGIYQIGKKTILYVSSGAGFWGPAIRFLAPSEIVIIEL